MGADTLWVVSCSRCDCVVVLLMLCFCRTRELCRSVIYVSYLHTLEVSWRQNTMEDLVPQSLSNETGDSNQKAASR